MIIISYPCPRSPCSTRPPTTYPCGGWTVKGALKRYIQFSILLSLLLLLLLFIIIIIIIIIYYYYYNYYYLSLNQDYKTICLINKPQF